MFPGLIGHLRISLDDALLAVFAKLQLKDSIELGGKVIEKNIRIRL